MREIWIIWLNWTESLNNSECGRHRRIENVYFVFCINGRKVSGEKRVNYFLWAVRDIKYHEKQEHTHTITTVIILLQSQSNMVLYGRVSIFIGCGEDVMWWRFQKRKKFPKEMKNIIWYSFLANLVKYLLLIVERFQQTGLAWFVSIPGSIPMQCNMYICKVYQ